MQTSHYHHNQKGPLTAPWRGWVFCFSSQPLHYNWHVNSALRVCVCMQCVFQDPPPHHHHPTPPLPPQGSQCTTCAAIELACAAQVINSQLSQKIFYTPHAPPLLPPLSPTDSLHLCINSLRNNHSPPPHPTHQSLPPSSALHPPWTNNTSSEEEKKAPGLTLFTLCLLKCATLCLDSWGPVDVFSSNSSGPYLIVK